METTQQIGADYRVTIPASIRKVIDAKRGDFITFDVIEIAKKGGE